MLTIDVASTLLAVWVAFYLRIEQLGAPVQQQAYVYGAAVVLFVPVFIRMGLYRAVFRYAGIRAQLAVVAAVAVSGVLFFGVLLLPRWEGVPRSLGLI
ncbi:MAG: polysaccharide biosynthesis protein, partial [Proteobacteria bacterium]|nr:polysaccharide biosynthesis protein [Pseudomonadota bacterium]